MSRAGCVRSGQEPSALDQRLEVGWGCTQMRHSPLAGGQVAEVRALAPPQCPVPLKGCDTLADMDSGLWAMSLWP